MTGKVAVIMSIYHSDSVNYTSLAIESILNQSYQNFDFYIRADGELTSDVYELLSKYSNNPKVFIEYDDVNKGLAYRLNQMLDTVVQVGGYEFVARMDADDISRHDRIERQVRHFNDNINTDVIGSDVIEIDGFGNKLFHKRMSSSHVDILRGVIKKCPFNHPTVMFRTDLFVAGFRYKSWLMNTQDYYLWVDLLAANKHFENINEPLLYFRVDNDFHHRRGWSKAVNDFNSRMYAFRKLGILNLSNVIHVVMLFFLRLSPAFIKKAAYRFLR